MTNEQKAQSIWLHYEAQEFPFKEGPVYSSDEMITFAAFCLDKREVETGWRKYPDEKPIHGQSCLIWFLNETIEDVWIVDNWLHCYDPSKVIAWMPLPEYNP